MNARDEAWERIFASFNLLDDIELYGEKKIAASELKKFYEPRLLAKIDHSKNLPDIFRENGIGILPLSVTEYVLGKFNVFEGINSSESLDTKSISKQLPDYIQSVDTQSITSEQTVIHAAMLSGILSDFLEEEPVLVNSGRMRTGEFDFEIAERDGGTLPVRVSNAQIEIDAGFETQNSLVLLEAKNHKSVDFNIRQLYYPYRTWQQKIGKPIRNLFLSYENKELQIHEYVFDRLDAFSSIRRLRSRQYVFTNPKISDEELVSIYRQIGHSHNSSVHFPQANDFNRVVDLLEILADAPRTHSELAEIFGFHGRQAKYYADAALYLGLAEERAGFNTQKILSLSPLGRGISVQDFKNRNLSLARILLSIDSVATTYKRWAESKMTPTSVQVTDIFDRSRDSLGVSGSTVGRRASTVKAWAFWLMNLSS